MLERSEVRYAVADGHHIAFRVLTGEGDGDHDVVMISGGVFPMDALPDDPLARRLLEGLTGLGRLIVFDRRGVGLSDQITDWDRALRVLWEEDLAAVIDAAGLTDPVIFSWHGPPVARNYCARNPGRVSRLILWNVGSAPAPGDRWDRSEVQDLAEEFLEKMLEGPAVSELFFPDRWSDPVFREWHDAAGRAGASPGQAARLNAFRSDGWDDVDLTEMTVPTLVLARTPPLMPFPLPDDYFTRPAAQLPNATLVDLGEGSINPIGLGVDDVIAEITRFVTGEVRLPDPERSLAAILFTDVVGSTRRASEVGDRNWKALLDRHDAVSDAAVCRHGGELVKSTGDGVLAVFGSSTEAIGAARDITRDLGRTDLPVRIGIHVGQIDRRGEDVSGLALNVAARIMAIAERDQILVSDIVERVTDDVAFAPVGERELKDLDGTWRLFEVH